MLNCRDIANHSSDYLDGTLPRSRRLTIWLHLMMCGHCRRYLKNLRLLTTRLAKRVPPAEDEAEIDKIMNRIKREADKGASE